MNTFILLLLISSLLSLIISAGTISNRLSFETRKYVNKVYMRLYSSDNSMSNEFRNDRMRERNELKYPLIQLYHRNTFVSELFCGQDVETCIQRLKSMISIHIKQCDSTISSQSLNQLKYHNIYSDSQLQQQIYNHDDNDLVLLKIYRHGCEKCIEFDNLMFDSEFLSSFNNAINFLQVEESNIPNYMTLLKFRLSGIKSNLNEDEATNQDITSSSRAYINCSICHNTGIVVCDECQGLGYVMKVTVACFCSKCSGKKSIRCQSCGGKCINCSLE